MTHVSKRRIPDKTKKLLIEALLYSLSNSNTLDTKKVLSALLTDTEVLMLSKRLGIAYLLQQGQDEIDVADVVKVTRQTVARIKLQLDAGSTEARSFLLKKLGSWKNSVLLRMLLRDAALSFARGLIRNTRLG